MKNLSIIVIAILALLMVAQTASAGWWELQISNVYVNDDGTTITIEGQAFNIPRPPVVTLGDDPTPLTLPSYTENVIIAELPPLPDGDYVINVVTANHSAHQDSYDLTIAECPICGNGVVDAGEECDDGNDENDYDYCDNRCRDLTCYRTCFDDNYASFVGPCSTTYSIEKQNCRDTRSVCRATDSRGYWYCALRERLCSDSASSIRRDCQNSARYQLETECTGICQ